MKALSRRIFIPSFFLKESGINLIRGDGPHALFLPDETIKISVKTEVFMLWRNRRMSGNVIDRRVGGGLGIGGLLIGAVIYFLMGGNPAVFLAQNAGTIQRQEASPAQDDDKDFVSVVLADTEDVWNSVFRSNGLRYREPRLVLFRGAVQSACGSAGTSVGPFYCPRDRQVYLDLDFFHQLAGSLGAGGDFARAYVIAHEVGHHVQNLLGINDNFQGRAGTMEENGRNQLSVKMELQADCLAGVWANQTDRLSHSLEPGDIEEALNAASAVGDDRLQKATKGEVVPDSFTHGTSAQRVGAFKLGNREGDPQACLNSYSFE
jgi:predicted metalloprotease